MTKPARRGITAGISIIFGAAVGVLINLVTEGWNWALLVGLITLVCAWAAIEMRQAALISKPDSELMKYGREPNSTLSSPAQLPPTQRYFTGREEELAKLTSLHSESDTSGTGSHTLAIVGTAGVGKTSLAIHWARRVAHKFPDGQLFTDLHGFDAHGRTISPGEAIRGFLESLGVSRQNIPPRFDSQVRLYRSLVADRRMIILLDNARDAAQVRPLLPGSEQSLTIVTSRNRLTGLAAKDNTQILSVGPFSFDEALLFLARRLSEERVSAAPDEIGEIVRYCGRLPLALALVAARATINPDFPIEYFAHEMRDSRSRLSGLSGDDPDTNFRAVVSWSYKALTPPAQELFRLIGLHPGPDMALLAAASLAAMPVSSARPIVSELVQASLLVEHRPGRYRAHDLIQDYAVELSRECPAASHDRAVVRLLDYYLYSAARADNLIVPTRDPLDIPAASGGVSPATFTDDQQASAWFHAEHQALINVIHYADRTNNLRHLWQLAWSATPFLYWQGFWHQQADVQRLAINAAKQLNNPIAQANAHRLLANASVRLNLLPEGEFHLQQAITLYRQVGDEIGRARTHHSLILFWEQQGDYSQALDNAQEALKIYRTAGHRQGEAESLGMSGWCRANLGDFEQALDDCHESLRLFGELDNRQAESNGWDTLGFIYHKLGDYPRAVESYEEALRTRSDHYDRYSQADTLSHLGDTYYAAGEHQAAVRSWRRAIQVFDALQHPQAAILRSKISDLEESISHQS